MYVVFSFSRNVHCRYLFIETLIAYLSNTDDVFKVFSRNLATTDRNPVVKTQYSQIAMLELRSTDLGVQVCTVTFVHNVSNR